MWCEDAPQGLLLSEQEDFWRGLFTGVSTALANFTWDLILSYMNKLHLTEAIESATYSLLSHCKAPIPNIDDPK